MSVDHRTYHFGEDDVAAIKRCIDVLDDAFFDERHDYEKSCINIALEKLCTVMSIYDLWENDNG